MKGGDAIVGRGGAAADWGREAVQEGGKRSAVIWKTLRLAEQRFGRRDFPELLPDAAEGVVCVDVERVKRGKEKAAA